MVLALKLKKNLKDKVELAVKFYSIISILNDFKLTPLEIRIIAFTFVKGNIASGIVKEKFAQLYNSTTKSVIKTTAKLVKKQFLVKEEGKVVVNKDLYFNFDKSILLQLVMNYE